MKFADEHLGQLKVHFVDNAKIKVVHLGQKDLHLNKKSKSKTFKAIWPLFMDGIQLPQG